MALKLKLRSENSCSTATRFQIRIAACPSARSEMYMPVTRRLRQLKSSVRSSLMGKCGYTFNRAIGHKG